MAIIHVNDQNFRQTLEQNELVLVDFWAPWCGPCKMIAPILEDLDQQAGVPLTIAKLNVDDNPETAGQYGVMSIPTLKLFKKGEDADTRVGLRSLAELVEWVKAYA